MTTSLCFSPLRRQSHRGGDGARSVTANRQTGLARSSLRLFHRLGGNRLLHHLWPSRLTVLAYHRIADTSRSDFVGFAANVSATATSFDAQLRWLRQHFHIVSLDEVLEWLDGNTTLPNNPALITFDDGYKDMLDAALPVLRRHAAPAALFLATDCVGSSKPFFWDLAAYCFHHTARCEAFLPLTGSIAWSDEPGRRQALHEWITAAKALPCEALPAAGAALASALQVLVPEDAFRHLHLSWDDVRVLARSGVAIAGHTRSHAILSRIPAAQARAEMVESKRQIEAEVGVVVRAFAYPNGLADDYRPQDVAILRDEGFTAAFTLADGPSTLAAVHRHPLEIRRVLVMADDDEAAFSARLVGLTRFVHSIRKKVSWKFSD
ncbi:MAG: polysaccharide deacetylase family protein [Rhodospirillales bacterium]|nr:polysaccharide deacetylase family protein [Rhodospirillales bacterium]